MSQRYETLAEMWREEARGLLIAARNSNSLHNIVLLIAAAANLEHAARKLRAPTNLLAQKIAQIRSEIPDSRAECFSRSPQLHSTEPRAGPFRADSQAAVLNSETGRGEIGISESITQFLRLGVKS